MRPALPFHVILIFMFQDNENSPRSRTRFRSSSPREPSTTMAQLFETKQSSKRKPFRRQSCVAVGHENLPLGSRVQRATGSIIWGGSGSACRAPFKPSVAVSAIDRSAHGNRSREAIRRKCNECLILPSQSLNSIRISFPDIWPNIAVRIFRALLSQVAAYPIVFAASMIFGSAALYA